MSAVNAAVASPIIVSTPAPQPVNVAPSPGPEAAVQTSAQDNAPSQNQASQNLSQQPDNNTPPAPPLSSSIYTAVASVNAPTIRGTSVNVVT